MKFVGDGMGFSILEVRRTLGQDTLRCSFQKSGQTAGIVSFVQLSLTCI
jgi:hypothetical protein